MDNLDRIRILEEGMERDGVDCLSPSQVLGPASIEVETGWMLYGLVRRFKPLRVVQTGTHWGYSAAWIAIALAENYRHYDKFGKPELWTWDSNDYDGRADALLSRLGVRDHVRLMIGDSQRGEVPPECGPIDFLMLDADHATEAVTNEFARFGPHMNRSTAIVGFHDTTLDKREAEGVRRLMRDSVHREGIPYYRHWELLAMRNLRGFDLLMLTNNDLY